jgi:hypothetical protein
MVRETTITHRQVVIIAEALSAWQQTWLCRNPDLSHMTDDEIFRARSKAFQDGNLALEILTELHSECFRTPPEPHQ